MLFGFNASEVFQIAIEIEKNGKVFYDKAKEMVYNPDVKQLFHDLGLEEMKHLEKFTELKASLPESAQEGSVFDPDNEMSRYLKMMADMHVFRSSADVEEQLKKIKTAEGALKIAIEFEKDSVIFFLSMQDATNEEKGKKLIGQLVKEEQGHMRRLSLQLKQLRMK